MSMLAGVRVGECSSEPGVGGDVAEGKAYESMISIRLRVMVAIMGWRLEMALMVLKVYFWSSCGGPRVGESGVAALMADTRRACAGFRTHRALSVRPWSSVVLNSKPPLAIDVTAQRLDPSSMQISVTPLSFFAGQMTPTTSLEPQRSSSDFASSSLFPYASALTTNRSWAPSLSLVLNVRARRRVDLAGRRGKGTTSYAGLGRCEGTISCNWRRTLGRICSFGRVSIGFAGRA
jgi:hypothetical protein